MAVVGAIQHAITNNQVPENVLKPTKLARQALSDMVDMDLVDSKDDIQSILQKGKEALLALDKSMAVEEAMLGEDFGALIIKGPQRQMMSFLPSQAFRMTLGDSFALLSGLKSEQQFRVCPPLGRSDLLTVLELVANMMSSISPEIVQIMSEDVFYTEVYHRLGFFLHIDVKGQVLHSKAAADHTYHQMELKLQDPEVVPTLPELEPIQRFQWLLCPATQKVVAQWVVKAVTAAKTIKRTAAASTLASKRQTDIGSSSSPSAASTAHVPKYVGYVV